MCGQGLQSPGLSEVKGAAWGLMVAACPPPDATHFSRQNLLPAPLVLTSVHELDLCR